MRAAPPPAIMLLLGALTLAAGGQWLRTDDAAARQGPGPTVRRAGRLPLLSYARRCSGATRTDDFFAPYRSQFAMVPSGKQMLAPTAGGILALRTTADSGGRCFCWLTAHSTTCTASVAAACGAFVWPASFCAVSLLAPPHSRLTCFLEQAWPWCLRHVGSEPRSSGQRPTAI